MLILWQCNPLFEQKDERTVPVSAVKLNLDTEKDIAGRHLRDCSDDIDRRIKVIDKKIAKADEKVKYSLNSLRTKLVREKKKVDRSLKEIEKASGDTWQTISRKSEKILTDAKIETQKIEERVEDLVN